MIKITTQKNGAIGKRILILRSLGLSFGLTILKVTVGVLTNSLAIMATAIDSAMDFLVSLANLFFIKSAEKPADKEHPYGHGKIESLAGILECILLAGVSVILAGAAVHRFINPEPLKIPSAGIAVMIVAIILNLWHVRNLRRSMISTESQMMATEYVHYAHDLLTHLGVIFSLLLTQFTGFRYWDPLMSSLILIYILATIIRIFNKSMAELLDRNLSEEVIAELDCTIRSFHPSIIGFHDLRTRKAGDSKFIEFHLVLKGITSFQESHKITENLILQLQSQIPHSVITVHADPEEDNT